VTRIVESLAPRVGSSRCCARFIAPAIASMKSWARRNTGLARPFPRAALPRKRVRQRHKPSSVRESESSPRRRLRSSSATEWPPQRTVAG
jgi:hypothetical protein